MKKELNYIKTAFAAEWLKIKNLGLLILAAIFAIVAPVLSFVTKIIFEDSRTYNGIESSAIQQSLLSLLGTYGGFILILFIIISASRVAQIDHKNNGWTFLETQPLSKFSVYTGKFLVVVLLCLISEILFFVSTIFFACLTQAIFPQTNLDYSIDMFWILQTFLRLFIVGLGVISLQMMLSIIISGFNSFIFVYSSFILTGRNRKILLSSATLETGLGVSICFLPTFLSGWLTTPTTE